MDHTRAAFRTLSGIFCAPLYHTVIRGADARLSLVIDHDHVVRCPCARVNTRLLRRLEHAFLEESLDVVHGEKRAARGRDDDDRVRIACASQSAAARSDSRLRFEDDESADGAARADGWTCPPFSRRRASSEASLIRDATSEVTVEKFCVR